MRSQRDVPLFVFRISHYIRCICIHLNIWVHIMWLNSEGTKGGAAPHHAALESAIAIEFGHVPRFACFAWFFQPDTEFQKFLAIILENSRATVKSHNLATQIIRSEDRKVVYTRWYIYLPLATDFIFFSARSFLLLFFFFPQRKDELVIPRI